MKYFLHDTSASDDEKVSELFMYFGYEGIGLFYCVLERIAKQEKPIKTVVLKRQLSVGKKLEKCWSFMEEIGLISSNNEETFNKQLLKYSEKYKIKKESNTKRVSEWREKQQVTETVTHYESVRNTSKVKESKVKVNKDNSTELFEPVDVEVILTDFQKAIQRFVNMRKKVKKPMTDDAIALVKKKSFEMSKGDEDVAVKILDQSTQNSWTDIYPLKKSDPIKLITMDDYMNNLDEM